MDSGQLGRRDPSDDDEIHAGRTKQAIDPGDVGARRNCAISVMAKVPRPGRSKTRLCPPLSPEQAAQLSAAFLRDTTENIALAAQLAPITGYVAYAPLGADAELRPYVAPDMACVPADGGIPVPPGVEGFGRCLLHAVQELFARGHTAACVLSSDTPTLPTAALALVADLLLKGNDRRVVLGPCDDGGYYLLGMCSPYAGLFTGIPWSTEAVAEATRDRAAALGLELLELPAWYDIDDAATLVRLLQDTDGYAAPRTRAAMNALGLRHILNAATVV